METIALIQGSPEWHAHRAKHFNASDAPAMMGCSPYKTRTQLLHELATGIKPEVDAATQRRFDDGHRFEALARPVAEKIIGEDLYAVVGVEGNLSASFDGLTMLEDTAFEHKSLNAELRAVFDDIETVAPEHRDAKAGQMLPLHYRIQMEQQCMVAGCTRVLFMATAWDRDLLMDSRHCWYYPDAELRARILAGWAQFQADLLAYVPAAPEAPKATGRAPESLPALRIEVTGAVTASNLDEFKAQALAVFQGINRDLKTDEDFANAEATAKWAKGIEDRLAAAKDAALAQTESIDRLFKTVDDISAEARRVRLDLEKLVKARKDAIRSDIVVGAQTALAKHIRELNAAMPGDYMPQVPADFAGAIKGLRTLDSIRNAVDTELARAKITASEIANRIHVNVKLLKGEAHDWGFLFPDLGAVASKPIEDFSNLMQARISAHQKAEEARQQREAEARAKAAQVVAAVAAPVMSVAAPVVTPAAPVVTAQAPVIAAPAPVEDDGDRIKLGDLNALLAPVTITSVGLSQLGFEPVAMVQSARYYRRCDFPRICAALIDHIRIAAGEAAHA